MQPLHTFCWLDLAASDAGRARRFYAQAFGWQFDTQQANGGVYTRCRVGSSAVASLYQLQRAQVEQGVPSHWTPYLRVAAIDDCVQRIARLGGRLLVAPFDVPAVARIALIEDAVGALVGLWQSPLSAQSTDPLAGGTSRVAHERQHDDVPVRLL